MDAYIINYDLRNPGRDYRSLYAELRTYPVRSHPLESTWMVRSNETAVQIRDRLVKHMDANDGLLVVKSANVAAWRGLSDEISKWLKEYV